MKDLIHYPTLEETTPTEFVGGFYPRGHLAIIASRAGGGKTWYLLQLLADLTRGGTIFLEHAYHEPKRRCLLFVGETNMQLVTERINKLARPPEPNSFAAVSVMEAYQQGIKLELDTQEGAENINAIIKSFEPDIVVIDTLMSFRRDDENSSQSTRDMCARLQTIATINNIAVLATHHLRKRNKLINPNMIDQDEIIGSSALVRQVAVAFILAGKQTKTLSCVKSWFKTPPDFIYQMRVEDGKITFEYGNAEDNITSARLRCQRFLEANPTIQITPFLLAKRTGVSITTARDALKMEGFEQIGAMPTDGSAKPQIIYGKKNTQQVELPIPH